MLSDHGDESEGAALFPEALEAIDRLAAEYPSMPSHRLEQELCLMSYGKLLGELDRPLEAAGQFRRAVAVGEKLVAEDPAGPWYKHTLGLSCGYFANLLRDGDNPAESLGWYDRALSLLDEAYARVSFGKTSPAPRSTSAWGVTPVRGSIWSAGRSRPSWNATKRLRAGPADEGAGPPRLRTVAQVRADRLEEAVAELGDLTRSEYSDAGLRR